MEAAVAAGEKAKVVTTDNQSYIFKQLENKNNQLTGITTLNSVTSKKLSGTPGEIDGKYLEYDLSGLDIREVKLRNESASILGSIAAIAGFLGAAWVTVMMVSLGQSDLGLGAD